MPWDESSGFVSLLGVDQEADDALLQPTANSAMALDLEPEETVMYRGNHSVQMARLTEQDGWRGRKKVWETVVEMQTKADLACTTHRLLFSWPKWKSDDAVGSIFERRILAPLFEKGEGRMLLAGHVRHPWITDVFVSKPEGRLTQRSRLRVDIQDGEDPCGITIHDLDPDTVLGLAEDFVAEIAQRRIEHRPSIKPESAEVLKSLAAKSQGPKELDWGWRYFIPAAVKYGCEFNKS